MIDVRFASIRELRGAYARREVTPVDVARTLLESIEKSQPVLNAFIHWDPFSVLNQAAAADDAIKRREEGSLLGIPIALKDLIDVEGEITTSGSAASPRGAAEKDAAVVTRLRKAGAIILGKLNLHEYAFGATNENDHFGVARNPWDTDRIPGGSSGGSAIAVAAGLCTAALGSDTGGSIRIPAALCGVTGFKGTYGAVSRAGVFPLAWSADHVGPLTRSAEDAAIVFDAIRTPSFFAGENRRMFESGLKGLRIGILRSMPTELVSPAVAAAFEAAVASLRELGGTVTDVTIEDFSEAPGLSQLVISSEAAAAHASNLLENAGKYGVEIRQRLRVGQLIPATAYIDAQRIRARLKVQVDEAFEGVDVIVLPTTLMTANRIGEKLLTVAGRTAHPTAWLTRLTSAFNLTGVPAISVPAGFDEDGLPIGLQIVSARGADDVTLAVAAAYQRITDWHEKRPPA